MLLLVFVSFLANFSRGGAQTPGFWRDPRQLLLLGIERLAAHDFREALPLLEAARRLAPTSPLPHAWLAHALHLERRLDEAAAYYRRLVELEPAQDLDERRREAIIRLAPRVFQVTSEPFRLRDAVAIHHPEEPLIAYHFFWEDDIDFPADNDPCDHELVWIRYERTSLKLIDFYTYFHGRILSTPAAVREASDHGGRPRVNVQWGKHGSLPYGWEEIQVQANAGDLERKYLDLDRPRALKDYNFATYQKLRKEGRQDSHNPRTVDWPIRFEGSWDDFVRFEKEVDLRPHFSEGGKAAISRWNNATLQQRFLAYNFRPKTEWPDLRGFPISPESRVERRVGASSEYLMDKSEAVALREAAGIAPDPFLALLGNKRAELSNEMPPMSVFAPETPRYPNVWIYAPIERFPTYLAFLEFLDARLRSEGYDSNEVSLNEGADLAWSIEHLQPWNAVEGLRHAHDLHVRFFWRRLERESLHTVELQKLRFFWRVAASVHYEVEHAHPLHADMEVCPICGRTGDYASKTGNLVERVHDPLGVELFIWGRIHGEAVRMLNRKHLPGLKELLGIADRDIVLSRPNREVMNTEALAAVIIRSKK